MHIISVFAADKTFLFGTDTVGRDLWTRTWHGARVSLIIAFVTIIIDMIIGMSYGLISGYFGGAADSIMQRFVEIANSVPRLVIVSVLAIFFPKGMGLVILALLLTEWISMSKIARAEMLKLKEQEYVLASRTLGAGSFRIIFGQILPNTIGPIITQVMFSIPTAIFTEAFLYYCRNNILLVEIRKSFSGSREKAVERAEAIRNAYYEVKKEYPVFTASLVGCGMKYYGLDREANDQRLENAVYIHENIRDESDPEHPHDFLIGLDLINEEDNSYPLIEFADRLDGILREHPDLYLLLHAGESLNAASDNVIDAYLLGAKRIGHGLNLYRFPELMELMRKDGICLEVCPISNQSLRYAVDLRSHPAAEYLKRGMPICLCSDDPVYQEHRTLTDDFFAAIACWDLGIAEIKQLCMNSIIYSCMDDARKEELMRCWESRWESILSFGE